MDDAKRKSLVVGGAGVAAATVFTNPALAAAVTSMADLAFETIGKTSRRRAESVIERMAAVDESPDDFAEFFNARIMDESGDFAAAVRYLLVASIEAAAPGALEPIALIGRRHLRQQTPTWIARGWIRLLAELSELELRILREIVGVGIRTARTLVASSSPPRIEFDIHRGHDTSWIVLLGAHPDFGPSPLATGHAARLIDLMRHHQLGTHRVDVEPSVALRKGAAVELPQRERFVFHDDAFKAIAEAFPDLSA